MQAKAQEGSHPSICAKSILLIHVKCDEARPICTRCSKSRKQCSYEHESGTDLIFRNFAAKLSLQVEPPLDDRSNSILTAATHPAISHIGTALDNGFINPALNKNVLLEDFLHGFCIKSKDHNLSRGYLDGLPRLLEHGNTNTNVSKAANAAALGFAGMRYQRRDLLVEAEKAYASLLRSFRKTIVEIEDSTRIDTFMTTVLLGLYEIMTATDISPGAQNIHLQGLSAILTAAGPPFDLLGGIRVFSSANALPTKSPAPSIISFATMLEPPVPGPVQNLDATMSKLQPVLSQSDELLSSSSHNIEALYAFFDQVSEAGQELDTWRSRQVNEWQPHTLLHSAPDRCCIGKLELRLGRIETYYDGKPMRAAQIQD
ncbi:hypothetical protein PMZ80_002692 [Knufia obscura]|uniref:Zn(2)-C6 fungal-type domain-containing protein n=1 Tax=Knufia obscura TaxID=1635080 RepID=A0ABR0RYJ1_9EURO|nr:hypothetical protein PMZ80_002692 [Knufia obscura]